MKFHKKSLIIVIISLLVYFFTTFGSDTINANGNSSVFEITINCENDIDYTGLSVSVYDAIKNYDNEIEKYDHHKIGEYEFVNSSISFSRPSIDFLIKIDTDTLPNNYFVKESVIFVEDEVTAYDIQLEQAVSAALLEDEDGTLEAILLSSDGEKLIGNYDYEIEQNENNSYNVNVYTSNYMYTFIVENEIKNQLETEVMSVENLSSQNSTNSDITNYDSYQNYFNILTTSDDYLEYVDITQRELSNIYNYFCNINGYEHMCSNENKLDVILCESISDSNTAGITALISKQNGYNCLIKIAMSVINDNANYLKFVLAHEFIHSIFYSYTYANFSNSALDIFEEDVAAFMALRYVNEFDIYNNRIGNDYVNFYDKLWKTLESGDGIFDNKNVSGRQYEKFLIPYTLYGMHGDLILKEVLKIIKNVENNYIPVYDALKTVFEDFEWNYDYFINKCYENIFNPYNLNLISDYYLNYLCSAFRKNMNSQDLVWRQDCKTNYRLAGINKLNFSHFHYGIDDTTGKNYSIYQTIGVNNGTLSDIKLNCFVDEKNYLIKNDDDTTDFITVINKNINYQNPNYIVLTINSGNSDLIITEYSKFYKNTNFIGNEYDINEHYLINDRDTEKINEIIFKPDKSGLFKFNFFSTEIQSTRIKVEFLDNNHRVMKDYITSETLTFNFPEDKDVTVALCSKYKYYIRLTYVRQLDVINNSQIGGNFFHYDYKISMNSDFCNYSFDILDEQNDDYNVSSGNIKIIEINSNSIGMFKINVSVLELLSNEDVFIEIINFSNSTYTTYLGNLNSNNLFYEQNIPIKFNGKKYIIIHGINRNIDIHIHMERIISDNVIPIATDLNANVTTGTMVTMRNGVFNGRNIVSGYSRIIYPQSSDEFYKSRLNYNWYSTDETKAIVSKYGTVIAMPVEEETTVKIVGVHKSNLSTVLIVEFTIIPDTSNIIKNITLTTDQRTIGVQVGTEVSENHGEIGSTLMHTGFTRLITFASLTPSDSYQDFIWTSSDDDVASVSQYGTITAKEYGIAIITGVYKYNSNFVATITVRVNYNY